MYVCVHVCVDAYVRACAGDIVSMYTTQNYVHEKQFSHQMQFARAEVIMLTILCIYFMLFRVSCNFLHYAPNSMYYSQNYS